jgi:3-oxoacyl-[acyl-carrier protein] reductase
MRRALVTGGSGAIGAAICRKLAVDGHHVYVHANSGVPQAEKIVTEIVASGGSAASVTFNVTDHEAVTDAWQVCWPMARYRLCQNAGIHDDAVMPGMRRTVDTGNRCGAQWFST